VTAKNPRSKFFRKSGKMPTPLLKSMLKFTNLGKNFGLQTVLNQVNLEIAAGEFVALMGPSGAGKSTLLSLILGADKPTAGSITIDGMNVQDLSPANLQLYRRKIGVVFQDFKLLRKKTVFENVAYTLQVCGESDVAIEHKVGTILQRVGLGAMAHKFPAQLSGGEQQRVAIARALVHSPKLLLADEPTGNLDPDNTHEIAAMLKKFHTEDGVTVIVTTHDPIFLVDLQPCRILRVENGKILEGAK